MRTSNWPGGVDYSHSNHTLRFPRVSKYDGMGAWAKDSGKIPASAWVWSAVVVAIFVGMAFIGTAAGL